MSATVSNIVIASPSSSGDNLTIDSSNGDPVPAGGLTHSGAGGLIKIGLGTLTMSLANSYEGGTSFPGSHLSPKDVFPGGILLTADRAG